MTLRLRLRLVAQLAGGIALLVVACLSPILGDTAVGASTSISNLQQKAAEIAQRVATIQTKLQVLAEEYDQAKSHLALLQHDVRSDTAARNAAAAAAAADHRNLIAQAVDSYVNNGSIGGISSFLSAKSNSLPAQQTYLEAAAGTLSSAVDEYHISVHQLSVRTAQLSAAESLTNRSLQAIGQSSASANELEDQLTATLSAVRGQVATLVAIAQRKAAIAAAARAAAASTVRQAAIQSSPAPATAAPVTTTSDTGGAAGEIAVKAAETQLGVPYVWAGSSPGVGFDCSGLAMWAWGHAGVNLPHSAAEQYASIAHVSMSDLQPGDLIFYGYDGYVYHVIMYIGGGRAIQAIDTGTVISITPVWPGAVGAGRP